MVIQCFLRRVFSLIILCTKLFTIVLRKCCPTYVSCPIQCIWKLIFYHRDRIFMYIHSNVHVYMCLFRVHVQKKKRKRTGTYFKFMSKKERKDEFTKSLLLKSVSVYDPLSTYSLNIDYSGFCRIVHIDFL